jgi:nitrogen regulatory protein PII
MGFWTVQVEPVIDKIIEKARTGEIGDGKIFCKCYLSHFSTFQSRCWVCLIHVPFGGFAI